MVLGSINNFLSVLVVGSLILLSFLFFTNPLKVNKKANLFFGGFTLLWATFWLEEMISITGLSIDNDGSWSIVKSIQLFTSIFFFFGIVSFTSPHRRLKITDIVHLIIPLLYLLGLILKGIGLLQRSMENIWVFMILFQALVYTALSYLELRKHEQKIELISSDKEEIDLKWIKQVIISLVALSVFFSLYSLFVSTSSLNFIGNCVAYLNILFIGYHMMKQKEIFIMSKDQIAKIFPEDVVDQDKQKLISDTDLEDFKYKLLVLMDEVKPYLERDLSLQKLAKIMSLTPHHLSYLLNEGLEENFFQFINKYRVEEAKNLLVNKSYDHLSVIGIAYESGFNSKTAFNTFFKKTTGKTPTEFKKISSY